MPLDVDAAQRAAIDMLRNQGCGCCEKEGMDDAKRRLGEAIGLTVFEDYAGELRFARPINEATGESLETR